MTRDNFNKELNEALKEAQRKTGRLINTHSFRIYLVTELLQDKPIQEVKQIIGHKDIRTTEVYERNLMGERELRKALAGVYRRRKEGVAPTKEKEMRNTELGVCPKNGAKQEED